MRAAVVGPEPNHRIPRPIVRNPASKSKDRTIVGRMPRARSAPRGNRTRDADCARAHHFFRQIWAFPAPAVRPRSQAAGKENPFLSLRKPSLPVRVRLRLCDVHPTVCGWWPHVQLRVGQHIPEASILRDEPQNVLCHSKTFLRRRREDQLLQPLGTLMVPPRGSPSQRVGWVQIQPVAPHTRRISLKRQEVVQSRSIAVDFRCGFNIFLRNRWRLRQ